MKTLINNNWIFAEYAPEMAPETVLRDLASSQSMEGPDGSEKAVFRPVDIPHDWMITDVHNLYRSSVGAYARVLTLDASKHNSVFFEGVYMRTTVYLNGQEIFFWPYGYTSFEVDLTPYQREGTNELLVCVDYRCPNTRWYSGAGIFRDVWLLTKESLRIPEGGVYVHAEEVLPEDAMTSDRTDNKAAPTSQTASSSTACNRSNEPNATSRTFRVIIDTEISSTETLSCEVFHTIRDAEGQIVAYSRGLQSVSADPVGEPDPLPGSGPSHTVLPTVNTQVLTINSAVRWDIEDPYLYTLETRLVHDGETTDSLTQKLGLRTIEFTPWGHWARHLIKKPLAGRLKN